MTDFRSTDFLRDQLARTIAFHYPRSLDPAGGFFHYFHDDGRIEDAGTRHLVSSTRAVFNFALAWREFKQPAYFDAVVSGITYLRAAHRDANTGGYAWILRNGQPIDRTNHCYGLAFVLLAYSHAFAAGHAPARAWIDETWELLEQRFWKPIDGLYADEASADWQLTSYRGQNANMHACEALLAAFEATGEHRYLERAALLADNMVNRQATLAGGQVWEHYDQHWNVDWDYNKGNRENIFRPWGFQPGHQVEWAKLLLILDRHDPQAWHLKRARELFDKAAILAWDPQHQGLIYGYDTEGKLYDGEKYAWVQAETFATAALLALRTGEPEYWIWYERVWAYCWRHFIDHTHGNWYSKLGEDNRKLSASKGATAMTDYHALGASYEVLTQLRKQAS